MKIEQAQLIQELQKITMESKAQILEIQSLPIETLNYKPDEASWSVLECVEHLCLYGKFYLPEIENRISNQPRVNDRVFKSGLIGNYFVNMIKASNTKKMKTTRDMDTAGSNLSISTLHQFLKQLEWLDALLVQSVQVDMTRVKTSISLSKLIKLRLGDTLRFVVHHIERHMLQTKRVLQSQSSAERLT